MQNRDRIQSSQLHAAIKCSKTKAGSKFFIFLCGLVTAYQRTPSTTPDLIVANEWKMRCERQGLCKDGRFTSEFSPIPAYIPEYLQRVPNGPLTEWAVEPSNVKIVQLGKFF